MGIFSREVFIPILRAVGAGQGRVIAAAPLGKTKTVMQIGAVTLLILQRPYPALIPFADIAVAAAVVFTLGSGLDYLWRFRYLILPLDTSRVRVPSGGAPESSASRELGDVLRGTGLTISVAESMTGGMVGTLITDTAGSSEYFLGGVIAYSNDVKADELGVSASLFTTVGAVSREVAEAMAGGARTRLGSSLAVAVTGIAGPDADRTTKPVGLTYIAVASASGVSSREFRFTGDRASNRRQAAHEALRMLIAEARTVRQAAMKSA